VGDQARPTVWLNNLVQGTAASIVKQTMVGIWPRLPNGARLIAQIHDELIVETPEGSGEEVLEMMKRQLLAAGRQIIGDSVGHARRRLRRQVVGPGQVTYSLHKVCATEGCSTRVYGVGLFCGKCFAASPEGKRLKQVQEQRRRYELKEAARVARGLPLPAVHCSRCIHWHFGCGMGFPEGIGSFAEDCAVFTVTAIDLDAETNHPDIQQNGARPSGARLQRCGSP